MKTAKFLVKSFYILSIALIVGCSTLIPETTFPQSVDTVFQISTSTFITETPFRRNTPFMLSETPLPTLQPEDAYIQLQTILKNNGNCRLPCWWGIIPGKTPWHDASHFLKTFSTVKSGNELGVNDPNNDYAYHYAYFQVPPEFGTLNHSYIVKNDVVTRINAYVWDWSPFLYLNNILKEYGSPDGVFITTYQNTVNGNRPYILYVIYEKLGILLLYSGGNPKNISDTTIQNCFENMYSPFVYIWSIDNESLTAEKALEKYFQEPMSYPVSIEKAANININTFYEKFKNPSAENCLITPLNLWTEQ